MTGKKHDDGKLRYSLIPFSSLQEIVKVLEHGAEKYGEDNWKSLDNPKISYINAIFRHLVSYVMGERTDPESGLSHLAHIGTSILFLLWFDQKEDKV